MNAVECPSPDQLLAPGALSPQALAHVSRCENCQAALAADAPSLSNESSFAVIAERYQLKQRVGAGAHGEVWRARDVTLQRTVAVKLLHGGKAEQISAVVRLLREARVLARLNDPNVVRIYDGGTHQGRPYLVTEWLAGGDVAQWLAAQPRGWREIVTLFAQAASGLAAAHSSGVIHRDFKPSNLVLDAAGTARVADFGLSRSDADPEAADTGTESLSLAWTQSGHVAGTPAYLAPERLKGEAATPQSDQFSFFVSLYEALEGARPFDAGPVCRAFTSRTPRVLRAAIARGLASDPTQRWPDLEQARQGLLQALQVGPRRARFLIALAAVGVLAATAVLVSRWHRQTGCAQLADRMGWTSIERTALLEKLPLSFPGGGDALSAASKRVEAFDRAWRSELAASCLANATVPTPRWSAQEECFRRQMLQVRMLSQQFTVRPKERLPELGEAIAALPRPGDCRHTLGRAPSAGELESLKLKGLDVGRLDALKTVSDYQRAKTEAESIVQHAREHGFLELEAEALIHSSSVAYYLGDEAQALEGLTRLLPITESIGTDYLRFQTLMLLGFLKGARFDRPDEAKLFMAQAEALAARIGVSLRDRAELAYTRGVLNFHRGDRSEAIKAHQQALALLTERGEHQSPLAIHVLRGLAQATLHEHHAEAAIGWYRQATKVALATLGEGSMIYASAQNDLGSALHDRGLLLEAQAAFRSTSRVPQSPADKPSPNTLITQTHLAWLEWEIGSPEKAREDFAQLLAQYQTSFPGRAAQTLSVLRGVAQVALALGDKAAALSAAKQQMAAAPAAGPARLRAFCRAGFVYLATDERNAANDAFQRAQGSGATPAPDSPEGWCLDVGRLLAGNADVKAADLLLRMSSADTQAAALYQAAVHFHLARSSLAAGDAKTASASAEQGKQMLNGRTGRRVQAYQRAFDGLTRGQPTPIPAIIP